MHIIDGSTFTVTANEAIQVEIRKTAAPYQASVSDLTGAAAWAPKPQPAGLTARGGFTAPAGAGNVVTFNVRFDFPPDATGATPPGDQYVVTIRGLPNEETRTDTIFPPPPQDRNYLFRVV